MIVQAISLLDDVDKELNNYIMRAREWYGWHFPELGKVITDNLAYVKTVKLMGESKFYKLFPLVGDIFVSLLAAFNFNFNLLSGSVI